MDSTVRTEGTAGEEDRGEGGQVAVHTRMAETSVLERASQRNINSGSTVYERPHIVCHFKKCVHICNKSYSFYRFPHDNYNNSFYPCV